MQLAWKYKSFADYAVCLDADDLPFAIVFCTFKFEVARFAEAAAPGGGAAEKGVAGNGGTFAVHGYRVDGNIQLG